MTEDNPVVRKSGICSLDWANREAYFHIPTAMSPESFVRGAVSTPEQPTFFSDARNSSTQSAPQGHLVQ